jgi:TonB family protein
MLAVISPSRRRCFLVLFFTFGLLPKLHSQSTEADIKSRLMDKPLYLRGFWRDDTLHFDAAGHLTNSSAPFPFTLSGFQLKKVHLKQDKLIVEGRRVGLKLADNKQIRVSLDPSIQIDIAASPTGDYGQALDAIFANGLADLVPSLPFYWKTYASKNFMDVGNTDASPTTQKTYVAPASSQESRSPNTTPHRIGGGITNPRLLHSSEPSYSSAARSARYGGTVLVNLWVTPQGTPAHLSVLRALGMGLDENALYAVQQYVFAPATENGKPVLVELNVEIKFEIQ